MILHHLVVGKNLLLLYHSVEVISFLHISVPAWLVRALVFWFWLNRKPLRARKTRTFLSTDAARRKPELFSSVESSF
jgi:hypothetical protein